MGRKAADESVVSQTGGGRCLDAETNGSEAPPIDMTISATRCVFDADELRWVSKEGDVEAVPVRLTRARGGVWRFILDDQDLPLADLLKVSHLAPGFITVHSSSIGHLGLRCTDREACRGFHDELVRRKAQSERLEEYDQSSVQSYFQYYAKLANQQNMLQDGVRTSLYRRAIVENPDDFRAASVMDVGAGTGILSFFAAQAGASVVYAVEASSMAEVIEELAESNDGMSSVIKVVNKPLESVADEVHGKVDAIVSEPIGIFLFNERMIETFLCARDRFLRSGGRMFPSAGDLCIAPFSDPILHWELTNKSGFWKSTDFYGINLNAAAARCTKEHFRQPVVDYINPTCLMSLAATKRFDFQTISVESLQRIEMPFDFEVAQPCLVHGLAGWFDAIFEGSNQTITLSTAPWCPGTHWYQIRFPLEVPLAVNAGQHVEGDLVMEANKVQSYFVRLRMKIRGTDISSDSALIDLKDPQYRFYTSQNAYVPPGTVSAHGTAYVVPQSVDQTAGQGLLQAQLAASQLGTGQQQQGGGGTVQQQMAFQQAVAAGGVQAAAAAQAVGGGQQQQVAAGADSASPLIMAQFDWHKPSAPGETVLQC